jgi:hypothetical protein
MADKPPSFQWYPKDCDSDEAVRLMDDAEFGFYVRCLNHCWLNDGLPASLDDIARLFGRPRKKIDQLWGRVGKCFSLIDGRYRNPKQELQRAAKAAFSQSKREAAEARWGNPRARGQPPEVMREHPENDAHALQVHVLADAKPIRMQCSATATATAYLQQQQQAQNGLHVQMPLLANWPQTASAIGGAFPATDSDTIVRIILAALAVDAAVADCELPQILDSIRLRKQRSAALFLRTLPAALLNRRTSGAGRANETAPSPAISEARLIEMYVSSSADDRAQLEEIYPEMEKKWPRSEKIREVSLKKLS